MSVVNCPNCRTANDPELVGHCSKCRKKLSDEAFTAIPSPWPPQKEDTRKREPVETPIALPRARSQAAITLWLIGGLFFVFACVMLWLYSLSNQPDFFTNALICSAVSVISVCLGYWGLRQPLAASRCGVALLLAFYVLDWTSPDWLSPAPFAGVTMVISLALEMICLMALIVAGLRAASFDTRDSAVVAALVLWAIASLYLWEGLVSWPLCSEATPLVLIGASLIFAVMGGRALKGSVVPVVISLIVYGVVSLLVFQMGEGVAFHEYPVQTIASAFRAVGFVVLLVATVSR